MSAVLELPATPPDSFTAAVASRLGVRSTYRPWGLDIRTPSDGLDASRRWHLRMGRYERDEAEAALACFRPGVAILQAGGGLGVVASVLNRLLKPVDHLVLEGNDRVLPTLRENMRRNGCRNYTVENRVLCACPGHPTDAPVLPWSPAWSVRSSASVAPRSTLREAAVTLPRPFNLLLDVEGCETSLLEPAFLRQTVDAIVLDLDPVEQDTGRVKGGTLEALEEAGFRHAWARGQVHGLVRRRA